MINECKEYILYVSFLSYNDEDFHIIEVLRDCREFSEYIDEN
jgi:hypothetical protein